MSDDAPALGLRFESEIREQPAVWRRLAGGAEAHALADALRGCGRVVLVGSGSSLFVAMLGALALRRRGVGAVALAATEAAFEAPAYRGATVVALSQSGRSADVLRAADLLEPARLVALTNDAGSPLALAAQRVVDVGAGPERAVPATKSVTAMVALVLWSAALLEPRRAGAGGGADRDAASLRAVADVVDAWLGDPVRTAPVRDAAVRIARRRSVAVVGAGYGVPIACELALKLKESTYLHAEGFAAGEFRHGSAAILDAGTALIGIVDDASREVVRRPLAEAERSETLRYVIGAAAGGVPELGPPAAAPFNTLGWLATGQLLALEVGRARGIDGDAPRGLTKFVG